jgi:hypothetical protein
MVHVMFATSLFLLAVCLVLVAVQCYVVFHGDDSWQHRL